MQRADRPMLSKSSLIIAERRSRPSQAREVVALVLVGLVLCLLLAAHYLVEASEPDKVLTVVAQPGDTLWSIARQVDPNGHTGELVWRIRKANGLQTATIRPGQLLEVPMR